MCCIIVSTVGWTWCDWSLILKNLSSFSALTLLVGLFDPYKPDPDMTWWDIKPCSVCNLYCCYYYHHYYCL